MPNVILPFPEEGKNDKETIQNLTDTVIKLRKELEFILGNLDEDNVIRAGGVVADWVYAGNVTTDQLVAGLAKIDTALIGDLSVDKLTASDGTSSVSLKSDGTINFTNLMYGLKDGDPTFAIFPTASLIKINKIQSFDDNNNYDHAEGKLTLGRVSSFTVDALQNIGVMVTESLICSNFLSVIGSKNSLQQTTNYGDRLINAYETAEYYFGDIGLGIIGNEGQVTVAIDEIFQECVNTSIYYHVFTQVYNGNISNIDKYNGHFIVYGIPGTEFSWELKAKRLGYETNRMEIFDEGEEIVLSNIEDELNYIEALENNLLEG